MRALGVVRGRDIRQGMWQRRQADSLQEGWLPPEDRRVCVTLYTGSPALGTLGASPVPLLSHLLLSQSFCSLNT